MLYMLYKRCEKLLHTNTFMMQGLFSYQDLFSSLCFFLRLILCQWNIYFYIALYINNLILLFSSTKWTRNEKYRIWRWHCCLIIIKCFHNCVWWHVISWVYFISSNLFHWSFMDYISIKPNNKEQAVNWLMTIWKNLF